jgi:hypothetical protein
MSKKTIQYLAFSLASFVSYGQKMFSTTDVKDLVALEYEIYPGISDVQFNNKAVNIDFTSLLNQSAIGFGVNYTNRSLDFDDYETYYNFSGFEELHHLEVFATYKKALINNWNLDLTFAPYLSSTLNDNITSEDFILSYSVDFIKSWDKEGLKSHIKLGAGYGSLFGKPSFYPLISYSSNVNEKLRYEIGFPLSGAFYKINTQSSIDFTAQPESIYAHNTSALDLYSDNLLYDSKLEFKALKVSLGYKFQFDSNWSSYFNVGYLTASELSLEHNDHTIYDFDSNGSLSLNIGISLNINNK